MPDVGDAYIIHAEFKDRLGNPFNPNLVSGWVEDPDGVVTSVVFSNPETGVFESRYFITDPGLHWVIVRGSGGITAATQRSFKAKAPAFDTV